MIFVYILLVVSCHPKQVSTISSYHENGQPKIIEYYDIFFGDSILIKKQELYDNGNLKYQNSFKNDNSTCSSYDINGIIIEEKFFTNNNLDSLKKYNHSN